MFKNIFKKKYDDTFLKVIKVALVKRDYISDKVQILSFDSRLELFLFNSVIASSYMINNKIIPLDERILSRFLSTVCMFAGRIKTLPEEQWVKLIYDRMENYGQELNLVANSQFAKNEHFPIYFFRRVYHYPLELNEMPTVNKWDEDYYEGVMLLDIYKHQVNEVKQGISEVL